MKKFDEYTTEELVVASNVIESLLFDTFEDENKRRQDAVEITGEILAVAVCKKSREEGFLLALNADQQLVLFRR